MHLVDITMFYAAEGGGVSTYLNAKARWLAQRTSAHHPLRHTILSPNLPASCRQPGLRHLPGLPVPGLHGYRSGFWGHVRLPALPDRATVHIGLRGGLDSGTPIRAELGTIAVDRDRADRESGLVGGLDRVGPVDEHRHHPVPQRLDDATVAAGDDVGGRGVDLTQQGQHLVVAGP